MFNLTIVIALTAAFGAQAQEGNGPGRGRFPGPNVGFTTLDLNGDGTLDATEIEAAAKSLAQLDKNRDGQITSDEARAALMQGRGPGGPGGPGGRRGPEGGRGPEGAAGGNVVEEMVKTLMAFDTNGDGKLARAELPERFQGMFDRGDENKDGFLTQPEIRKMAAAQAQAQPADAGGPGGRGGDGRGGEMNAIRIDPILAAIDTDGDGVISAEEMRHAAASVRKLDRDGDGKVSREEVTPAGRGREF